MLLGLTLFTATLLLQAASLLTTLPAWPGQCHNHSLQQSILPAGAVVLTLLHALGLFSTSFILSEGQMVCFLVASMALLLLYSAISAALQSRQAQLHIHASAEQVTQAAFEPQQHVGRGRLDVASPVEQENSDRGKQKWEATPVLGSSGHTAGKRWTSAKDFAVDNASSMWSSQCMGVVFWGIGLLVCNALLGSMGLVTRTGHDAMHKAAATTPHTSSGAGTGQNDIFGHRDFLVGSFYASLHWLSSGLQQTQDSLAPALCVLIFPIVLLGGLNNSKSTDAVRCTRSEASALANRFIEILVWLAYLVIALLWVCQGLGLEHMTLLSCLQTAVPIEGSAALPLTGHLLSTLLTQPLSILLPELCLTFLSASVLLCTITYLKLTDQYSSSVVIAMLVAPVILVLRSDFALASVLAMLECVCIQQLFHSLAVSEHQSFKNTVTDSKALLCANGWMSVAEGSMWALISTQLFFCTGHFCEFAGLQYTAGRCAFPLPSLLCRLLMPIPVLTALLCRLCGTHKLQLVRIWLSSGTQYIWATNDCYSSDSPRVWQNSAWQ